MRDALARKLAVATDLTEGDRQALAGLVGNERDVKAGRSIILEGDDPRFVHLMLDGWAVRSKALRDGTRQITAILLPGDFCDLHVTILDEMDHSIVALTDARVAYIRADELEKVATRSIAVTRAFWWLTLLDEAVLRSWVVSLGRRSAIERIAHLICELHVRLGRIDMVENDAFDLPFNQDQLADVTGLTPVHLNRRIGVLREQRLLSWKRGKMTILDLPGLQSLADFDPNYLHTPRGR